MALLQKDLDRLQPSITAGVQGMDKLRELIMGKDLDRRNTREQQQQKSDLEVSAKQSEQRNALDALQEMDKRGMINEGGSATVNGVGYGKGYDPMRAKGMQDRERGAVLKLTKPMGDSADQLERLNQLADLMDSPNGYDQKQAAVLQARLAEGQNQRLLQSVIESFGSKGQSVPGIVMGAYNKIKGGAASTLTPDEMNALREHAFKQKDYYGDQLEQARKQYDAQAPVLGSGIPATDIQTLGNAPYSRGQSYLTKLQDRQKAFSQASGAQVPPAQQNYSPGITDRLANWLGGGGGSPKAAPAAPAAPQGGQPPMSFEEFKAARKAGKL